jgi:hypothetical protein
MPLTPNVLRLLTAIIVCSLLAPAGSAVAADLSATAGALENQRVRLNFGVFSPGESELDIPSEYRASASHELRIIQTDGPMTTARMRSLEMAGVEILSYIPDYNYLARLTEGQISAVLSLPAVTWIGDFHPAFKMPRELLTEKSGTVRVVVGYHEELFPGGDPASLRQAIWGLGGDIFKDIPSDTMLHAELPASALPALAGITEVSFIEKWLPLKKHMDHIKSETGALVSHLADWDGSGIVGEVKDDGIDQTHIDFGNLIGTYGTPAVDSHGTCTFGIVFSDGYNGATTGNSSSDIAIGMMRHGDGVFANWQSSIGNSLFDLSTNWGGRFQTNSWGTDDNGSYSQYSMNNDKHSNTYNILVLQSGGNDGLEPGSIGSHSAAKNVICAGALRCGDNDDRSDDAWRMGGAGNTPCQGPTDDGRVKPDLVANFDWIFCTDEMGSAGYSVGPYTRDFGGTSGSCPIIAGAAGLTYQMYEANHFGENPEGDIPLTSTVKGLLIANAHQYDFDDATRYQQGWGFVDVGRVSATGPYTFVQDGGVNLETGENWSTTVTRYSSLEPLKITLCYADVEGAEGADPCLVNDLDLKVTAPDATVYWGNNGLIDNLYSTAGGSGDRLNNVENVFIKTPMAGMYTIEVIAHNVALDRVSGTAEVDQHFSLIATMVAGDPITSIVTGPGPRANNRPLVRTWDAANGLCRYEWRAYGVDEFGVNVACGDTNNDGIDEIITGAGPGAVFGPHVRGWNAMGTPVPGLSYLAYGTNKFGVNVTCGDVDGDGNDEIITGAGPGAVFGPHVRGWNVDGGAPTSIGAISFFAYGTPKWGVNVACGDIDGDGYDEIISGAGPGTVYGPHVRGWNYDGNAIASIGGVSFLAYGTNQFGVNVGCGDIDGDGIDEIITGPGPGVVFGPHIRAWNVDGGTATSIGGVSFFAYDSTLYGAQVAALDVDNDGIDEILTMPGPEPGTRAMVRGWNYDGSGSATMIPGLDFEAYRDERFAYTYGGKIAGGTF